MRKVANKMKRNETFKYMYVLLIIMVIDDHVSTRIGLLSSIFPYNSFYMPCFVFISGYFYKKTKIFENIKHKIKKLFIPYAIWNCIAIVIAFILDKTFNIDWIKKPTINSIKTFLFEGSLTSLNGAAWFVIMLFWTSIIYNILHTKFKDNKKTDLLFSIIHIVLGFISIQLCLKGYNLKSQEWLFCLKIAFCLQFFHLGYMFKLYLEKYLKKVRKIIVCLICISINSILIILFGNQINFIATSSMNYFHSWILPLISSATGIVFYYEIMSFLSDKIGENRIINYISNNTFTIMESHLLFANIPNFYIYLNAINGAKKYLDFNINGFKNSAWIRYNANSRLVGFFCGLLGSLALIFIINKIKNIKKSKIREKNR